MSIARSLINDPQLLLLDEPTTGLDPQARHVLWDRLYRLKQSGVTLVLTTHYMDEAEQLCDRLVVMDRGKIVAEGSPQALIQEHSTREVLELRYPAGTNETWAAKVIDIGQRSEVLPDRALPTPTTARRRWSRSTTAAHSGVGARAAQLARGRLPPPHRPLPDRLRLEPWHARSRRWPPCGCGRASSSGTGRSGARTCSAFVQPLLYLLGMGLGVGALVDNGSNSDELLGGLSYFEFLAPRWRPRR